MKIEGGIARNIGNTGLMESWKAGTYGSVHANVYDDWYGVDGRLAISQIGAPDEVADGIAALADDATVVNVSSRQAARTLGFLEPRHRDVFEGGDVNDATDKEGHVTIGVEQKVWLLPGDGDGQLLLTTAAEHLSSDRLARQPNAGCLFVAELD